MILVDQLKFEIDCFSPKGIRSDLIVNYAQNYVQYLGVLKNCMIVQHLKMYGIMIF